MRFGDNDAAKGWEELCRQAPGNALAAWMTMRHTPAPPVRSTRHHRLRDDLAAKTVKGRVLDHWQIEVTGAGWIWYLVDREAATIWIGYAGPGHPRVTG